MADPTVAVCFTTEDRGKTTIHWQISAEVGHLLVEEFKDRFGEPVLEVTVSDAAVIDANAEWLINAPGTFMTGPGA